MPISSLIVTTAPGLSAHAVTLIDEFDNAEVTDHHGDQLVVITDTVSRGADKDLWHRIENTPGVIKVDAIYNNFEDIDQPS